MKVTLCTDLYPVGGRASSLGVTGAIRDLYYGMKHESNNFEFNVIIPKPMISRGGISLPICKEDEHNIRCYELSYFLCGRLFNRSITKMLNRKVLKDTIQQSDLVVSHMASKFFYLNELLESNCKNIKHIYVMHSNDFNAGFFHYAVKHADVIFSRSINFVEKIPKQYRHKYKGIVFSGIKRTKQKVIPTKNSNQIKILYAGALIKRKNVDLIIDALSKLKTSKKIVFKVLGDGPEKHNLEKQALNLDSNIECEFLGDQPQLEVFKLMIEFDIFIMPSINETFGLVYLEAMYRKMVTIGTKGEGIDGVIKHGENGYLLDKLNSTTLKDLLKYIINKDNSILLKKAENTASKYSAEYASKNYYAMLVRAISKF